MELIEQIREKCVEVNPALGAEHDFNDRGAVSSKCKRCGVPLVWSERKDITPARAIAEGSAPYSVSEETIHREIGKPCPGYAYRPIRLADVLLAIADHPAKFVMWPDGDTFEEAGPHLVMSLKDDNSDESIGSWGLLQDDLIKQSPETLAFIAKVLGITS